MRRSYSQVTGERSPSEPPKLDIDPETKRPTGRGGRDLAARFAGDDLVPDEDSTRREAEGAVRRSRSTGRGRNTGNKAKEATRGAGSSLIVDDVLDPDEARQLEASLLQAVGSVRAARLEGRIKDASRAFRKDRFAETVKILRPIVKEAPSVADARELLGVALYRLGRWRPALAELQAFAELTGSTEQHPVMMDCQRALGHPTSVAKLWEELREASPDAALVMEGRIVYAGSLADRGDLDGALRTLEHGTIRPKRPREHHLRRAYALADLYERAGAVPRARELFAWLAAEDPDLADVVERARALR